MPSRLVSCFDVQKNILPAVRAFQIVLLPVEFLLFVLRFDPFFLYVDAYECVKTYVNVRDPYKSKASD